MARRLRPLHEVADARKEGDSTWYLLTAEPDPRDDRYMRLRLREWAVDVDEDGTAYTYCRGDLTQDWSLQVDELPCVTSR
jgi:hypothetical protein